VIHGRFGRVVLLGTIVTFGAGLANTTPPVMAHTSRAEFVVAPAQDQAPAPMTLPAARTKYSFFEHAGYIAAGTVTGAVAGGVTGALATPPGTVAGASAGAIAGAAAGLVTYPLGTLFCWFSKVDAAAIDYPPTVLDLESTR
jgi:hypothetical protein